MAWVARIKQQIYIFLIWLSPHVLLPNKRFELCPNTFIALNYSINTTQFQLVGRISYLHLYSNL